MPENQAPAHSPAGSGAGDSRPATMGDLRHLETALRSDMNQLETSLRADMNQLATSLRAAMSQLENSLRGEMSQMRADMRELRNGQWKLVTLAIVGFPLMLEVVPIIFAMLRS